LSGDAPSVAAASVLAVLATLLMAPGRAAEDQAEGESAAADLLPAASLLLGEVDAPHLTIRTSIVGPEWKSSHGLLAWLLGQRGGQVKGFTRALFSGLSTIALSRILAEVVEQHRDLAGLWHVASEPISKYDLLMLLNEAFDANITIEADDSVVIDRTLDGSRFAEATGIAVPSWREMAQELAQ